MPKIIDAWVKKVMKSWKTKQQAYAIILGTLKKAWEINAKWNLTKLWKKRNAMSEKARHKTSVTKTKILLKKPKKTLIKKKVIWRK